MATETASIKCPGCGATVTVTATVALGTDHEPLTKRHDRIEAPSPSTTLFHRVLNNGRLTYPDSFEAFWCAYPTDPLMSKKKAYEHWQRMTDDDRTAANSACEPFRDFCRRHPTYRPVHAFRFLAERRFDGFASSAPDTEVTDKARDRADMLLRRGKYAPAEN